MHGSLYAKWSGAGRSRYPLSSTAADSSSGPRNCTSARYSQRTRLFLETRHIQGPGRLSNTGSGRSIKRVLKSVKQVLNSVKRVLNSVKRVLNSVKQVLNTVKQGQYRANTGPNRAKTVPNSAKQCQNTSVFHTPRFSYGIPETAICACPGGPEHVRVVHARARVIGGWYLGGYTGWVYRVGNRVGNTPYPAIPRAEVPTASQRPQGAGPALQGQGGLEAGGDRPFRVSQGR